MQLINSTVIRELSIIFFSRSLYPGPISGGGSYIRGLITEGLINYRRAYNGVLISGGHISWGLISGAYIPGGLYLGHISLGAYIWGHISQGLIPRGLLPGGLITGGPIPGGLLSRGLEVHTNNF